MTTSRDDIGGGLTPNGAVMGFRARIEGGGLVLRKTDGGRRLASGWDALLDRLSTLDRTTWHDLHPWREWPAEEAIAMGQPFALREVALVLVDLATVYLATVWPGGRAADPREYRAVPSDAGTVPGSVRLRVGRRDRFTGERAMCRRSPMSAR